MGNAPVAVRRVLDRLVRVRRSGEGWLALCPAHADSEPSLTVGVGADGRALVNCHRGCSTDEIVAGLGLEVGDLFEQVERVVEDRPELVATYDYVDAGGELVFQVVRYRRSGGGKTFRQRRPDGRGGWLWSLGDVERPLFRLPRVLGAVAAGEVVWVVEGEKDVLTAEGLGLVATCNAGGAGGEGQRKWLREHSAVLAGAKVVVVADRDEVGCRHARVVAGELRAAGALVKLRVPPEPFKDLSDLVEGGLGVDDLERLPDDPGGSEGLLSEGGGVSELVAVCEIDPWTEFVDLLGRFDPDVPLEDRVRLSRKELDRLIPHGVRNPGRTVDWVGFIDEVSEDVYDWLIPGLIEREERVMIVAAEGVGKSVLARQVAILTGAGIHPFTYSRMVPVRTLFVDLENPERIIRRASRQMVGSLRQMFDGRLDADAFLWTKPDGLNVLNAGDRVLLEERLDEFKPDLLVFGPLYKFYIDPGGRTSEAVAIEVASYLDYVRTTYRCALWIEHHAPLGASGSGRELRPMGSAVWLRWPEFGYSIAQDPTAVTREYVVGQWRGPRDERTWPLRMKRGTVFPWEVIEWSSPTT